MKEIRQYQFSATDSVANAIIDSNAKLAAASAYKDYGHTKMFSEVVCDDYELDNEKVKKAILAFASNKAGISVPATATDMAFAFDNPIFRSVMNSITTRTLGAMMVKYESPQINRIANIETVGAGESRSYEIEPKALPIAQKGTYGSNVSLVPSYAKSSVTVTPKPYTLGLSLDYVRILANGYDWGKAVARIYAGMIFAQYKLITGLVFSTTVLAGTPFYQANFSANNYVQLADDIGMLNGGSAENVTALGTRVAWNSIAALATSGGFTTKDDYIRNAYLQKIFGVDSMVVDQFSNLSAPFNSANAASLRAIPNNLIVLISNDDNKVVKLCREDYIRVIETNANENTLNRQEYTYMQNFDAQIATASFFGVQNTQA